MPGSWPYPCCLGCSWTCLQTRDARACFLNSNNTWTRKFAKLVDDAVRKEGTRWGCCTWAAWPRGLRCSRWDWWWPAPTKPWIALTLRPSAPNVRRSRCDQVVGNFPFAASVRFALFAVEEARQVQETEERAQDQLRRANYYAHSTWMCSLCCRQQAVGRRRRGRGTPSPRRPRMWTPTCSQQQWSCRARERTNSRSWRARRPRSSSVQGHATRGTASPPLGYRA